MVSKAIIVVLTLALGGCVTASIENDREEMTGLLEGEAVVVMAKSYHQGNETEADYIRCVERALGRGMNVIPNQQFIDNLFPWFEPRTAPADTKGLVTLMEKPGVPAAVERMGVRYIIWLDGGTERVTQGGSLSCAAGPGGGGNSNGSTPEASEPPPPSGPPAPEGMTRVRVNVGFDDGFKGRGAVAKKISSLAGLNDGLISRSLPIGCTVAESYPASRAAPASWARPAPGRPSGSPRDAPGSPRRRSERTSGVGAA